MFWNKNKKLKQRIAELEQRDRDSDAFKRSLWLSKVNLVIDVDSNMLFENGRVKVLLDTKQVTEPLTFKESKRLMDALSALHVGCIYPTTIDEEPAT